MTVVEICFWFLVAWKRPSGKLFFEPLESDVSFDFSFLTLPESQLQACGCFHTSAAWLRDRRCQPYHNVPQFCSPRSERECLDLNALHLFQAPCAQGPPFAETPIPVLQRPSSDSDLILSSAGGAPFRAFEAQLLHNLQNVSRVGLQVMPLLDHLTRRFSITTSFAGFPTRTRKGSLVLSRRPCSPVPTTYFPSSSVRLVCTDSNSTWRIVPPT